MDSFCGAKCLSAGPYPKHKPEDAAPRRVLACCWGPGDPSTTFVLLDSFGELLDVLHAGSISLPPKNADTQQCIKKDQGRLLKFMKSHKPGVVALGAANLSCPRLYDNIFEVMFEIAGEILTEDDLIIVYVDESLPRLYENSRVSGEQLPHQSGIERLAVALGRYLQNPLAMVATLCGPGKEILSWNLHSLQNFLDRDDKCRMVEQVMVDITNQDWRRQYREPSVYEELSMISGETITEGRIMQATVHRVRSGKALCVLACGLVGMLLKEGYSNDGRDILDLSNRLCEGDILTCKIKSTQKNNLPRLLLVSKEREMRNIGNLDPYYHE